MNRVGRLLICIAGGVALSVTAHADVTPATPAAANVNALRQKMDQMNRMLLKKHHMSFPKGFPQASQPNLPQSRVESPANAAATAIHPSIAPAESEALSGNPYDSIVTRNVFGLNPIPPATEVAPPSGPPPPKITLTGITTIFGPAEALFKVAGVIRNGHPQDESYIFTEGEQQDEVEVTKIDTAKHIVSFVNHGVQQDIPLSDGVASTGSTPAAPTWPGLAPGGARHFGRFMNRQGAPGNVPRPPGGFPGANNGSSSSPGQFNNSFGGNNGSSYNGYNANANSASSQPVLSPDDQAAVVAAEHAQAVQANNPIASLFPPTKYDQEASDAAGGSGGPGGSSPAPIPGGR